MVSVLITGCNSGDHNPAAAGADANNAANLTGPITFKVILPDNAGQNASTVPLMSSIRAVEVTPPTVTFKLILVNTGNSGVPTSTMVKTAAVSESGAAEATFTGVPAGTCIGDIHIDGGNIDSYSDFHGAIDLAPGVANTLYVTPKGSKLQPDFVAYVIEQIVATPVLFGKALPGLTSQVVQAIAGLDKSKSTAYSDAIAMFARYVNVTVQVSTTAKTITYNGNGNETGSVPVDTNSYGAGEVAISAYNTGSLRKTGYIFSGWNTQIDGLGTTYTEGSTLQLGNENITLYAKWEIGATLTLSRLFPAGSFGGNIRAAVISLRYSDLFMNITVNGTKIRLNYLKHTNKAAGVEVGFAAPVLPSVIEAVRGSNIPAEIMIQPTGTTFPAVILMETLAIPTTLTSGTSAVAVAPQGVSTTTPAAVTTAAVEAAITAANPTATIADPFTMTSAVSTDSAAPTSITPVAGKYTFAMTFNQAYTNAAEPTFNLLVTNLGTGHGWTFTGAPVAIFWGADKKSATLTFTPDSTYQLVSGQAYAVTLVSTNAVGTDGVKFTLPPTFYVLAQ